MRLLGVLVMCALLLVPATARADDSRKSEGRAAALAIGGTLVSGGLIGGGLAVKDGRLVAAGVVSGLLAPAAGHIYARDSRHVGRSAGVKIGASLVILVGYGLAAISCESPDECLASDARPGRRVAIVGALLYAGAMLWDIGDAPYAARRHNLALSPTVLPATDGRAPGVVLSGAF